MADRISDEMIDDIAILAKLELSQEERKAARKDMECMLDYVDKLKELDTSGAEPLSHIFPLQNVFREDIVENGNGAENTLANAPQYRECTFVVPKTLEQ